MKPFFLLLLIFSTKIIVAQAVIENKENVIQAFDLNGKRIPMGAELDAIGNKMLNEKFSPGIVKFTGLNKIFKLLINFSLFNNELYFKKDSIVLTFINPVDSFALTTNENGVEKQISFKCNYPATGGNSSNTYYELLSTGTKLHLLKYKYKVKEERYTYGGPVEKEYADRSKLYIYDAVNNSIYETNTSAKNIAKSSSQYASIIADFSSKKKIKTESDLVALVSFINSTGK